MVAMTVETMAVVMVEVAIVVVIVVVVEFPKTPDAEQKPGGAGRMSEDAEAHPDCLMKTLMTPDHIIFQVRSSG